MAHMLLHGVALRGESASRRQRLVPHWRKYQHSPLRRAKPTVLIGSFHRTTALVVRKEATHPLAM